MKRNLIPKSLKSVNEAAIPNDAEVKNTYNQLLGILSKLHKQRGLTTEVMSLISHALSLAYTNRFTPSTQIIKQVRERLLLADGLLTGNRSVNVIIASALTVISTLLHVMESVNEAAYDAPMRKYIWKSKPISYSGTEWRVVVYDRGARYAIGGQTIFTDYEWLDYSRSDRGNWTTSKEWPSYDHNDTYDGLPKPMLDKLYNANRNKISELVGESTMNEIRDVKVHYVVDTNNRFSRKTVYTSPMEWTSRFGIPNDRKLAQWVADYNSSMELGGVNDHLFKKWGSSAFITDASVLDQYTGETVATYRMSDSEFKTLKQAQPMFWTEQGNIDNFGDKKADNFNKDDAAKVNPAFKKKLKDKENGDDKKDDEKKKDETLLKQMRKFVGEGGGIDNFGDKKAANFDKEDGERVSKEKEDGKPAKKKGGLDNFGGKQAEPFDKEDGEKKDKKKDEATERIFYAWWNSKRYEIMATSMWDAVQKAREQLKVPKSKWGLLPVMNKDAYDKEDFRYENMTEKDSWPSDDKAKTGRFTEYCKREGFDGPGIECARHAMKSDDASVRGMASFYMNTVKPNGKDASHVAKGESVTEMDAPTRVFFRVWLESDYAEGDVIALFPDERNGNMIMSYEHTGQHGEAHKDLMTDKKLRDARPNEYRDLLKELARVGYDNLVVMKRWNESYVIEMNPDQKELEIYPEYQITTYGTKLDGKHGITGVLKGRLSPEHLESQKLAAKRNGQTIDIKQIGKPKRTEAQSPVAEALAALESGVPIDRVADKFVGYMKATMEPRHTSEGIAKVLDEAGFKLSDTRGASDKWTKGEYVRLSKAIMREGYRKMYCETNKEVWIGPMGHHIVYDILKIEAEVFNPDSKKG